MQWTNDEILRIIAKRIATYFGMHYNDEQIQNLSQTQISENILNTIIDSKFTGSGHWSNRSIHNVLLSLTRARPRDLVKLMQGAAKKAYEKNSPIITSKFLADSFPSYSDERLRDVINEHKSEMPTIERLLLEMRPTKRARKTSESYLFTNDALTTKISEIRQRLNIVFTNNRCVNNRAIIQFLYKIDFITARRNTDTGIDRKYFDQSKFLAHEFADFGYSWEIHPAYRWALQPQNIQDVISSLGR